ncbi:aspartate carbamoyltransferase catalytic subunit [Numidum massiliense]|uniref:aspartate carbamoyltransferase catalytic subunit n=1 Tax=Numidum massiliense TaxID=1522315 RepID=UPI00093B58AE|nr:aspartate carbamoyltransferase catalytic subunit [Numidum massiliense]
MQSTSLLTVDELSTEAINAILERADQMARAPLGAYSDRLKGKVMVQLFYEPSTRTRCSFELAAKRLGMDVLYFDADVSSVTKGESLWDTLRTLEAMGVDTAVIRHQHNDVFDALRGKLHMRLVNAGNGTCAHPTQALLDWLTMRQTFGSLEGLTVAIVGDIRHSRVARSNVYGLKRLGARPVVSGPDVFRDKRLERLAPYVPFERALREADVVMMLRIQRERLESELKWELDDYMWQYGLTERRMELLQPQAIVMHPGPVNRGIEIDGAVVEHPRSRIASQVQNGVFVRMAVLEYVLYGTVVDDGTRNGASESISDTSGMSVMGGISDMSRMSGTSGMSETNKSGVEKGEVVRGRSHQAS